LLPWVPALAFVLANGAAFALHADAVSPRYTIAAHVIWLSAVYASVLAAARPRPT
jgi:lipoprotein signal peptidase